jgi:hypothetical protein
LERHSAKRRTNLVDKSEKRRYVVAVTVDGETQVACMTPQDIAQAYAADDIGLAPFDCLWAWALDGDPDDPDKVPDSTARPTLTPLTMELFTLPSEAGGGLGALVARRPNGDVEFAVIGVGEPGARDYMELLLPGEFRL